MGERRGEGDRKGGRGWETGRELGKSNNRNKICYTLNVIMEIVYVKFEKKHKCNRFILTRCQSTVCLRNLSFFNFLIYFWMVTF